jgi:hypothetical protein
VYECVENGKTSTVRLAPNQDGTTTVIDLATGKKQRLNLSQYTNGATLKPIYKERLEPDIIKISMGIINVLFSFFMIYMAFGNDYKRYRLRRVIAVAAKENTSAIQLGGRNLSVVYSSASSIADVKRDTKVSPSELPR